MHSISLFALLLLSISRYNNIYLVIKTSQLKADEKLRNHLEMIVLKKKKLFNHTRHEQQVHPKRTRNKTKA